MNVRFILISLPSVLILFLLQTYFWVPTYQQQTLGNPDRLNEYITGSIGDASMLNPILTADSASSEISDMIFDGLIDRDENLHFRGRLAQSWKIYEEAYFYVNNDALLHQDNRLAPEKMAEFLLNAIAEYRLQNSKFAAALASINEVVLLPPVSLELEKEFDGKMAGETKHKQKVLVNYPARVKLVLQKVDQDIFNLLTRILGQDYFETFSAEKYVNMASPIDLDQKMALAKEILPAVEHNPVIVFYLRPNVHFHDGHIFDANDVVFTYHAIMNPENLSPRLSDYEPVKEIRAIDLKTVRIVYKRLYSPALSSWEIGMLPEHLLNNSKLRQEALQSGNNPNKFTMRQSKFNREPVGSGPFVFQTWKSDQYIILEHFDEYWEGRPNYKRFVYRIIPDSLTQEMEFYAGTLDNYNVQPHQVERLAKDPRFQAFSGLSMGYTYIGYNMRRPPFDNLKVRQALGMAINVDEIIKYVLHNQGERITGPFVKQTGYYNHAIEPLPYDPQAALRLFAEVGYKQNSEGWLEKDGKPLQFTLITNSGNDLRKAILTIAQNAWKSVGVKVRTDVLEWSVFIQERVNKLDFDALVLGWSMGIDPDLYQIWHSSQTKPHQLNFVGFANQEADELITRIRQEYDYDQQVEYCRRLHQIIATEQPYTFLYVGKWTAVLDKRIVIKDGSGRGEEFRKIEPTSTGDYKFYFNKWIKHARVANFSVDG